MSGPTVGALFAGYGGLELAVREVWPDAHPAWVSEFDAAPSRILAHRFPGVPNLGDVTKIRWADVEPVDIITGGSPCQDLSHAGKRAGMKAGTRSGLWASMCDAIDIIRPSLVIWENVRGALSAEADSAVEPCPICVGDGGAVTLRALGRVLGDLAELGYDAGWVGLRAADAGAPHGRFRVFVLAWPAADTDRSGQQGVGRLGAVGHHADGRSSAGSGPGITWGSPEWRDLTLLPTPACNDMGASYTPETWDAWTERMKAAHGNGNGHGASLSIEALRMLPTPSAMAPDAKVSEKAKRLYSSSDRLGDLVEQNTWGQYAPAIALWEALTRPAPPPTEPTGKGGAHRLSPRFVEWMMGLPDGWVTDVPDTSRNDALKALGNGVVPRQAAVALRWLLEVRADATRAVAS